MEVEVTGVKEVLANLGLVGRRSITEVAKGLFAEAENVMGSAKELTPVDTGALRASGHVQLPVEKQGEVSVTLGFGGVSTPYALKVHEDLAVFHPNGEAKYLERPFLAAIPGMDQRIGERIRKSVGR